MLALIDGDVQIFWAAAGSEDEADCIDKLHKIMQESIESCFTDEYKLAIKGKGNFRKDLYPFYKAKRTAPEEDIKARLKVAHSTLLKEYNAVMAHGMEADDQVRIWAEEARTAGQPFVVVAEDKDLKCIVGKHYNPKKSLHFTMNEDEADLFFHAQLLAGDPTDDIPGLWRVGLKTAMNKLLLDVPMGERMDKVVEVYKEKCGDEWYDKLLETGSLIHILKTPDDIFKIEEKYCLKPVH